MMNNDKLKELLISKLPDAEFPEGESQFLNVIIKPEELHSLCEFLKNNPAHDRQTHILNNYDWFKDFSFIHFLRDVIYSISYDFFSINYFPRCQSKN